MSVDQPALHHVRRRAHERGTAAVEFAIILPVLVFTFLAIADVSLLMLSRHELTRLALSASRHCVAEYAPPNNADSAVTSCAQNYAQTLVQQSGLASSCKGSLTAQSTSMLPSQQTGPFGPSIRAVQLSLSCSYSFLTTHVAPLLGGTPLGQIKIQGQASMPYINQIRN